MPSIDEAVTATGMGEAETVACCAPWMRHEPPSGSPPGDRMLVYLAELGLYRRDEASEVETILESQGVD